MKGTVKWYNIRQGYGFIKGEEGEEAFIHKNDIPFWSIFLTAGEKVEYSTKNTKKGLKATNVTIL